MKINYISDIKFLSGKASIKPNKTVQKPASAAKAFLYNDVNNYLNKKLDKYEYMARLAKNLRNNKNKPEYTNTERKYIYDIVSIVDEAGDVNKIEDKRIEEIMRNFLKYMEKENSI